VCRPTARIHCYGPARSTLARRSIRYAHCARTCCAIPALEARGYARGRKALRCSAAQRAFATTRPGLCQHRCSCAPLVPRACFERPRPAGARPHWRCRAAQPNWVAHRYKRCVERSLCEHRAQLAAAGGHRPAGVRGRVLRESRFGERRRKPERSEGLRRWGRVPAGLGRGANSPADNICGSFPAHRRRTFSYCREPVFSLLCWTHDCAHKRRDRDDLAAQAGHAAGQRLVCHRLRHGRLLRGAAPAQPGIARRLGCSRLAACVGQALARRSPHQDRPQGWPYLRRTNPLPLRVQWPVARGRPCRLGRERQQRQRRGLASTMGQSSSRSDGC